MNCEATIDDIQAYFGLLYLFGLIKKSSLHEHWSKNPLVYNPLPLKIMPFHKFQTIRSKLCLYDPWEKTTEKNPIRKIEFMID